MNKLALLTFAALFGVSASAAPYIVVVRGAAVPEDAAPRAVVDGSSQAALDSLAVATGARVGKFPALVDSATGRWVPISSTTSAAESALAKLAFDAAVAAKSPDQLALEAEYFEAADALHVLAGGAAPTNDEPASLSAVKAMVEKAKGTKGGSKKADDYLEILASHVDLLTLDLELRAYDPDWRSKAKRPKE